MLTTVVRILIIRALNQCGYCSGYCMESKNLHNQAFGTVIARLRRKHEWSQEELAFQANLTRTYIYLLEQGKRSPTLDSQMKLCFAFEIQIDALASMLYEELQRRGQ